ncbi:hypothetical protein GGR53DRAFT_526380 [Hypoxylon sp. FL1150]|nr:hypothetical protein GGR53DRAFT_526380 [Hypoxylon sp. FL1150]
MNNPKETLETSSTSLSRDQVPGTPGLSGPSTMVPANETIMKYLLENSAEFRKVNELREKGWSNPEADIFFKKQRENSDNVTNAAAEFFYELMKKIGEELHHFTHAFVILRSDSTPPQILDMCMAPGGFLATAMRKNPGAQAMTFSLPVSDGGHKVFIPKSPAILEKYCDITMLAKDMGSDEIPADHPDADRFLPGQFKHDDLFDLVLCDGHVLRTHAREQYRDQREARRLTTTQLALGVEHLRPGGTIVVLLHKMEKCDTVALLQTFSKFSSVRCFKPQKGHRIRSSFYMVATNIQSQHPNAVQAINTWKAAWKIATFGTDEEYKQLLQDEGKVVEESLADFGTELVNMGRRVWRIQSEALSKAPFMPK